MHKKLLFKTLYFTIILFFGIQMLSAKITLISTDHSNITEIGILSNENARTSNLNAPPHPLEDDALTENFISYFDSCSVPLAKINLCVNDTYDLLIDVDPATIVNITWEELIQGSCFNRMDDCPAVDAGCDDPSNWTVLASGSELISYLFDQEGEYRVLLELTGGISEYYYFDVNIITPIYIISTLDPTCGDPGSGSYGSVDIQVIDGLSDYEYRITGGPNNIDLSGVDPSPFYTFSALDPGQYTVEIFSSVPNSQNCFYGETVTINPAPPFDAEVVLLSAESCNGAAMVEVIVTAGSGGPYEYADIGGVFTTNNIFEIPIPADPNASYSFSISDISGPVSCVIMAEISGLLPYTPFAITNVIPFDGSCTQGPGSIEVSVATSPSVSGRTYTYQLYDCANDPNCNDPINKDTTLWILLDEIGPIADEITTFSNVGTGTNYAVSVFHNDLGNPNGGIICREDATMYAVQDNTSISASTELVRELSCIAGQESAQILVTNFTGGSGTYEWSIDGTTYTSVTASDVVIDIVTEGEITVFVRDSNDIDCFLTTPITITQLEVINDIIITETFSDCLAQTIEVIVTASPTGPTSAYYYSVTPAAITEDPVNGLFLLNTDTMYTFTAERPENGCSFSDQFFAPILSEVQISNATGTDVLCNGGDSGFIEFTVSNSLSFYWEAIDISGIVVGSGNESGSDPTVVYKDLLIAGTYTITVIDTSSPTGGCIANTIITITEPSPIIYDTAITDITTDADGQIEVNNVSGGIGGVYEYELRTTTNVLVPFQTGNSFVIATPGRYFIAVRDTNGCELLEEVVLLPPDDETPITEYADEILFCTVTGQSYPVVIIENAQGEVLDLPYVDVLSIIWEQLDEISCTAIPEDDCPTTDTNCSSDWIEVCTGPSCTISVAGEYRVVVQFANKSVNNTQTYYFKSDNSLGLNDISNQKINIYPNPATDIVELNTAFKNLVIFDMMGKKVFKTTSKSFDVSVLENGMYFIKVIDLQGKETLFKFMKK